MLKRILSILVIMCCSANVICMADDKIEEYKNEEITNIIETSTSVTQEPKINSRAAVIIDRKSKSILYGKNEMAQRAMASTTKIMTAMVVIQNTNLENTVEISKKAAATGGSVLKIKAGDKITVRDLLYGLLLRSGNDTAVALAEYVGGSIEGFSKLMNQNAENLGLSHTHFVTPHGLDHAEHYTTAYELALLTDYALNNEIFAQIVGTKTYNIKINGSSRTIHNTNELLGNLNGVYGVKTGFTNGAGRCLVTSVKRGDMDIICVVIGADTKKNRTQDSVKLIEYTFQNYELINLNEEIKENFKNWNNINKDRIQIEKAAEEKLELELVTKNEEITYPIKKGSKEKVTINIEANLKLKAPVEAGTQIGKVIVKYEENVIKEIDIVNKNRINKKRINNYIAEFFNDYSVYLEKTLR